MGAAYCNVYFVNGKHKLLWNVSVITSSGKLKPNLLIKKSLEAINQRGLNVVVKSS